MKSRKKIRSVVTAVLLVIAIIVIFLIQSIFIPSADIGLPVFLLLPLTASVALYEKDFAGMFFGIFAGVLTDLSSSAPDGIYTLFFALFAFITGYLSKHYFRNTTTVAFLFSLAGDLLLYALSLIVNCLAYSFASVTMIITTVYVPAFIITTILSPFIYLITRQIEKIKNET